MQKNRGGDSLRVASKTSSTPRSCQIMKANAETNMFLALGKSYECARVEGDSCIIKVSRADIEWKVLSVKIMRIV